MKYLEEKLNIIIAIVMLLGMRYGAIIQMPSNSFFYFFTLSLIIISVTITCVKNCPQDKRKFIVIMAIFLVIISIFTTNIDILVLYTFSVLFVDYSNKKFTVTFMICQYIVIFNQVVLYLFNVIVDDIHYQEFFGITLFRHSFGTGHPNTLFLYVLMLFLYKLYLKGYFNFKDRIFYVVVLTIAFLLTSSRTGYIISYILLICEYIVNKIGRINKGMMFFLSILFPLGVVISVVIVTTFKDNQMLNTILSNRINYWDYYFCNNQISFLGGSLVDDIYLDNLYLFSLLIGGVLSLTLYFIIFVLISIVSYKTNDRPLFIITIVVLVHAYTEATMFNVAYIFIVPLVFITLLRKIGVKEEIYNHNGSI